MSEGVVELHCDLLEKGGESQSMIQQATPFTVWDFRIDPYSQDYIDVSNVESAVLTLKGSYLNELEDDNEKLGKIKKGRPN